jgi:hypothetical protein
MHFGFGRNDEHRDRRGGACPGDRPMQRRAEAGLAVGADHQQLGALAL